MLACAQLLTDQNNNQQFNVIRGLGGRLKALERRFALDQIPADSGLPTREFLMDFLAFQRYFFQLRTGIEFRISQPTARKSHHLTLANLAPEIFFQKINRLMVNIAPRYGKTEWAVAIILYSLAFFQNSRWMYISIDPKLVKGSVKKIIKTINLPEFRQIFGVWITDKSSDQSSITITTNKNAEVYGVSARGGIAGNGAGVQNQTGFSGGVIIDDFHKIDAVHSETERDHAGRTYVESILNRLNDRQKTVIIFIGQITHEDDLPSRLKNKQHDVYEWKIIELQSLDDHDNALYPEIDTKEYLIRLREIEPYMFAAQHQQNALPAGGAIFKEKYFVLHDYEITKRIIYTFITIDSAETDKNYNDATAMTFFGLYKIIDEDTEQETGDWGLHVLDCIEERIMPDKLKPTFNDFYAKCCMFHIKPKLVGIEKKSTGVTLLSVLGEKQGIEVVDTIPYRKFAHESDVLDKSRKNAKSPSKTNRFLACQRYVSQRFISLTEDMKYSANVIEHMGKITANDSHKHDDIADTISDAIHMVYISGYILEIIKNLPNLKSANDQQAQYQAPIRRGAIKW